MKTKRTKLVDSYRKYYRPKGIFECTVYDDIPDLLTSLKENGKKVLLATSKPEDMAEDILDHFGLIGYFDGVYGATHDRSRTDKSLVIAYALEEFGLTERDKAVMVGDREYDILGAKENGLSAIGVGYGYRQNPHEFEKADAVANTVAELKAILLDAIYHCRRSTYSYRRSLAFAVYFHVTQNDRGDYGHESRKRHRS